MAKLNTRNKPIFLISSIIALMLLSVVLFLNSPLFNVALSTPESHLEIGSVAETDPHFYLEGPELGIALSQVDTSCVKHTKVGRYPIYIYHGFQKFTSYPSFAGYYVPASSFFLNTANFPLEAI